MNDKVYDPKTLAAEIRRARWTLFIRVAFVAGVWTGIVLLFGYLLTL
jgi:hypothetical protein